ncbi:hypothetical protein [Sulfuriflexus mobilis]|uniref:hypothetical protein n=1 Tax=Sulfuriflexus mobilis TaxID=1811807 RepID=UPI000F841C70|nr:hypothetical protein [Sulfuriflexus mobilis]
MSIFAVDKLISQARILAADYRRTMGKPLAGISNEIAEFDAVNLLGLELCKPRVSGYDAMGTGEREGKRVQIKARVIADDKRSGHRVGQLKMDQDWDIVVLVIMDENYEATEIHEVDREAINEAMQDSKPGKRGAMSVAKFIAIGRLAWTRENGNETDAPWDNQSADQSPSPSKGKAEG